MTQIYWSSGGPLMSSGLVASSSACCCEGDPPCACPSSCLYFIGVSSPASISAKLGWLCDQANSLGTNTGGGSEVFDIATVDFPAGYSECQFDGVEFSSGMSLQLDAPGGGSPAGGIPGDHTSLGAYLVGVVRKCNEQESAGLRVSVYLWLNLSCGFSELSPDNEQYHAYVRVLVTAERYSLAYPPTDGTLLSVTKTAVLPIPTYCRPRTDQRGTCVWQPPGHLYRHFDTPLAIAFADGSTSLGDYTQEFVSGDPEYRDIVDGVFSSLAITFDITSRPSCLLLDCQCYAQMGGITLLVDGFDYTIGVPVENTYPDGRFDAYYGQETGPQTVVREVYNESFTQLYRRKRVDIYCENTADGVRYFGLIRCTCWEYDNGTVTAYSEDSWMGYFECYAAKGSPENNRQDGDPIPLGELVDVVYLGRDTVPIYAACEPQPRPSVRLREN